MQRLFTLGVLTSLTFVACGETPRVAGVSVDAPERNAAAPRLSDAGSSDGATDAGQGSSVDLTPSGSELAALDPAYLFDDAQLRTYELELTKENLATLDADPMAEQYVEGALVFEGHRVAPVGIRYKGSIGAFKGCLTNDGPLPSGSKVCPKLSLKLKIDWQDPKAAFYGQKKLLLHSMNADHSLMRERLGYGLFGEMGVQSSRTAYARVVVNGELVGLFALVEEVDGRFTKSRFADGGGGNLYKEVWPVGADEPRFLAGLETNRNGAPTVARMLAFSAELGAATDATLPAVIDRWMDRDYVASYIAVDRVLANNDGAFHWYCIPFAFGMTWMEQRTFAGGPCGNHNYYWYEESAADRMWPIPWDLDHSLNGSLQEITALVYAWDDLTAPCDQVVVSGGVVGQMPATCDALERGWALALGPDVAAAAERFLAGPFSAANVDAKLDAWEQQIAPIVAEASSLYPTELTADAWRTELAAFRTTIGTLRAAATP